MRPDNNRSRMPFPARSCTAQGNVRTSATYGCCRGNIRNIARTEANIAEIRAEAVALNALVDDPASPPIHHARERDRLNYLNKIVAEHETTRPGQADR